MKRPVLHFLLILFFFLSCGDESSLIEDGFFKKTETTIKYGSLEYNGFTYKTVIIGNQEWTVENLRTTKYNDGTLIPNITDNAEWSNTTAGAYCAYDNSETNVATYGYLYNFYAVNTGKLAPAGWRVPTDAAWTQLTDFVGGTTTAGEKLKSKTGWSTNTGTDIYGFNALPGGSRFISGYFESIGIDGYWWSSTDFLDNAWYRNLYYPFAGVFSSYYDQKFGFSIRLVRDL